MPASLQRPSPRRAFDEAVAHDRRRDDAADRAEQREVFHVEHRRQYLGWKAKAHVAQDQRAAPIALDEPRRVDIGALDAHVGDHVAAEHSRLRHAPVDLAQITAEQAGAVRMTVPERAAHAAQHDRREIFRALPVGDIGRQRPQQNAADDEQQDDESEQDFQKTHGRWTVLKRREPDRRKPIAGKRRTPRFPATGYRFPAPVILGYGASCNVTRALTSPTPSARSAEKSVASMP